MSARLMGWLAALLAVLVTLVLIVTEITNAGLRSWWGAHSMTTDTVSGLMVLLITVLVVNQLLNQRQEKQRSQAVASQAAIIVAQAAQSDKALLSLIKGSDDSNNASEGFRTYLIMLLISAPVFIDDPVGRPFLEQAQTLGGEMAHTLAQINKSHKSTGGAVSSNGLDEAMQHLQSAAAPLLQNLRPGARNAIHGIGEAAGQ